MTQERTEEEKQKLNQSSGVDKQRTGVEEDINKTGRENIINNIKAYTKLLNKTVRDFFSGE